MSKTPLSKTPLNALLIAGTDTDVGKTVLTCALAAYWLKHFPQANLGILKPLQTGIGDRERYHQLFNLPQSIDELNPLHFTAPLAPPIAASLEGRSIDLGIAWKAFERLRQQKEFVLVEGLGGLGAPITAETTMVDLAFDWHLPTILVVPVRLGAIGQAVANVALARQRRIKLQGIVLSCSQPCTEIEIDQWACPEMLESLTRVPILGILPHIANLDDRSALSAAAAQLDLERIMPLPFLATAA
jgi:dethiobiotin synthetase